MVHYDEWETFMIKFQVYEPFEDPQMDVRIQGNRPEVDNKVMKRQAAQDYLPYKYGKKVRPFEINIKFKQTPYVELSQNESEVDRNPEGEVLFQGRHNRFEYCYSSKLFNSNDVVYEREPHRVIEIQDPLHYRGQLGINKSSVQDSHKVFIVNGKIEKADGNFNGGFFFNKIKDSGVIIGTYPLSQNDILRMQRAGTTAVLNIQTGTDMASRGVFWPQMVDKYREIGIDRTFSYPISDKDEDQYIDDLFNCAQHLNDLIEEQGHTVYIHDNSSTSRAPTLLMAYFSLYLKIRTIDNISESVKLMRQFHHLSTPNVKVIQKLMKKHKNFVDKQRELNGELSDVEEDEEEQEDPASKETFLLNRKAYVNTSVQISNKNLAEEQEYLFNRKEGVVPFNGKGTYLDKEIERVMQEQNTTVPIVHVKDQKYLIGDSVEQCDLKGGVAMVKMGDGYERFDDYVL